eukprot:8147955-Alexandrium_andersonii.AAC.1
MALRRLTTAGTRPAVAFCCMCQSTLGVLPRDALLDAANRRTVSLWALLRMAFTASQGPHTRFTTGHQEA